MEIWTTERGPQFNVGIYIQLKNRIKGNMKNDHSMAFQPETRRFPDSCSQPDIPF
jgi:hypothetical protein